MFKVSMRPEVLKDLVSTVSILVAEAKLNITPNGINIKAVDPAHVAMIDLTLRAEAFETYTASEMTLGVSIERLKDIAKLTHGETITMEYDEERAKLVVKVGNITRRMAVVDTSGMTDPRVPNINLPTKIIINAGELQRGIIASGSVSDHISLIARANEGFEMISESDAEQARLNLQKDDLDEFDCKEDVKSMFSLDYFSNMIKVVGSNVPISLYLGTELPVRLEFEIANGNGHVVYLLAPRVESD